MADTTCLWGEESVAIVVGGAVMVVGGGGVASLGFEQCSVEAQQLRGGQLLHIAIHVKARSLTYQRLRLLRQKSVFQKETSA